MPHITMDVIFLPCWDYSSTVLVKSTLSYTQHNFYSVSRQVLSTHRSCDKIGDVLWTLFQVHFIQWKIFMLIQFSHSFVPILGPIYNKSAKVHIMALVAIPATSHYLKQCWLNSWTHIYVARDQFAKFIISYFVYCIYILLLLLCKRGKV